MANGRQFVYRYNGDPNSEEVEQDILGETPVPEKSKVIERKGKKWKVGQVNTEQLLSDPPAIPIYRIFLTDGD